MQATTFAWVEEIHQLRSISKKWLLPCKLLTCQHKHSEEDFCIKKNIKYKRCGDENTLFVIHKCHQESKGKKFISHSKNEVIFTFMSTHYKSVHIKGDNIFHTISIFRNKGFSVWLLIYFTIL